MKPCHICEKIIRVDKSIICQACSKSYCQLCTTKHFSDTHSRLTPESVIPTLRFSQCFSCLKQCKCHKCNITENVVINTSNRSHASTSTSGLQVGEEVAELGLFKGKRISQLPLYMQRIYVKKKVLYSKHQISCLSNDKNIPEQQNNQQPEEKALPGERDRKDDESINDPKPQDALEPQKNENEDEQQQAEDYESQFPSRRAAHLHDRNDQSAINDADVEDQMEVEPDDPNNDVDPERGYSHPDGNGESAARRAEEMEEEDPAEQNQQSSPQPAGQ